MKKFSSYKLQVCAGVLALPLLGEGTVTDVGDAADRCSGWTFLINHARVLPAIAGDPQVRIRDIAQRIGITERVAQSIVTDLLEAGYLERKRKGRRNR
jgi:hypothetical protein